MNAATDGIQPAALAGASGEVLDVPKRLFWVLTAIATIFVVISGVLYVIWVLTGFDASPINELYHIFDVAGEFNGGAWMAGVLWVLLAVATAWVAVHTRVRRLAWLLFAVVALMASLDEIAMLHERLWRLGSALGNYLPFDPFSYRWVIAGLLIAIANTMTMLRWSRIPGGIQTEFAGYRR